MTLRVHNTADLLDATVQRDKPWVAPLMRTEIDSVSQACCCPAPAVYAVVIAPQPSLPQPPEILLCAHHLRAARERLCRPDVAVYDAAGLFVEIPDRWRI